MEIFYVSTLHTLHTSQLRLSPPRNLIINPLSLLWDKLLPDQIGINRRISSGGGEVEEEQEVVQVTSAPDPDLSRLLRPAPVSTCPSPASSEGGVYTSVSLAYSLSEIILVYIKR